MSALLAINKPVGPTSHDVLQTLRRITGEKRIGHAGTLDPLASGVLVVGIGRDATKQLDEAVQKEKEYLATITLGETSTTDDAEGLITKYQSPITNHQLPITKQPTKKEVAVVLKEFIGSIKQVPPPYSAVKIRGQEAYKRARRGEKLNMPPRDVDIFSIELISYDYPTLVLKVTTGPGVYIRSLARDIGTKLKTGGYLKQLIRTRVGQYTIEQALTVEQFAKQFET